MQNRLGRADIGQFGWFWHFGQWERTNDFAANNTSIQQHILQNTNTQIS
jgi:hypothetical protein